MYIQVSKRNSTLQTDLYCKDTDRHQYLHTKSCHKYVSKKHIPFGQAVWLRRIISDDNVLLDERLKELETWFTNRNYNSEKVTPEIERVKMMSRTDLLSKPKKEVDNKITLVLTYYPVLAKVYEILQKAHRYMLKSQRLTAVLPSTPLLVFHNAKTLKDYLVRSN